MPRTRTAARMARLVARWRKSGESQASFARRHHVPTWTFWYWCRKLAGQTADADRIPTPATFIPIRVAADPATPVLEIVLRSGERVHVGPGASAELVQAAVTALRAGC